MFFRENIVFKTKRTPLKVKMGIQKRIEFEFVAMALLS